MSDLTTGLRALHVSANIFWLGSIVSVALVLGAGEVAAVARGQAALLVYRRLAVPAFLLAFASGLTRLALSLDYYFVSTHFMHAKLLLGLGVIALHHVVGARAKQMANGTRQDAGGATRLALGLGVMGAGAALLALLKPF